MEVVNVHLELALAGLTCSLDTSARTRREPF